MFYSLIAYFFRRVVGIEPVTFWEWIDEEHSKGFEHQNVHSIMWIKYCLTTGDIPASANPETYEDLKDLLIPLGFDHIEFKEVRDLWRAYIGTRSKTV